LAVPAGEVAGAGLLGKAERTDVDRCPQDVAQISQEIYRQAPAQR
jgi:hypothetical protein